MQVRLVRDQWLTERLRGKFLWSSGDNTLSPFLTLNTRYASEDEDVQKVGKGTRCHLVNPFRTHLRGGSGLTTGTMEESSTASQTRDRSEDPHPCTSISFRRRRPCALGRDPTDGRGTSGSDGPFQVGVGPKRPLPTQYTTGPSPGVVCGSHKGLVGESRTLDLVRSESPGVKRVDGLPLSLRVEGKQPTQE